MFGFFRPKKIPASEPERIALVRRLIKLRSEHSPAARDFLKAMELNVDEFEDSMLMMSAESGIMRIVEPYIIGIEQGAADDVIVPFLNQSQALLISAVGQNMPMMSPPFTLKRYVIHFLKHTNQHGFPIDESFVPIAIREVFAFYGRTQKV